MQKITEIKVTTVIYCFGDIDDLDMSEAVRNEIDLGNGDIQKTCISSVDQADPKWLNAYPYGEGGNVRTVQQWLKGD